MKKLDAISQSKVFNFCFTTTIFHFARTINPFILKTLSETHRNYIIQFLQKAIDFDNFDSTFSKQIIRQVSIPLELGGLNLTNTTYMSPAHHLDTFQSCSHQLATLYGTIYTDIFNHLLSLDAPSLHP
jgi:hypothetical protein